MHWVGAHHGEGRVESQSVLLTADLLHQAGRKFSDPANKNWRSTRVRACVRAVARCTVAWHSAVNIQLKRRGLTSRAPKTSLIQYFRWRNRASEQLLTAAAESRQDSSSPVAEPKSKYIASGRTPSPLGFPREVYDSAEVTASAEVCRQCEGSALSEGRYIHIFFPLFASAVNDTQHPGTLSKLLRNTSTPCSQRRLSLLHLLDYSPSEVSDPFHPLEFERCFYLDFSSRLFWSVDFGAEALLHLQVLR